MTEAKVTDPPKYIEIIGDHVPKDIEDTLKLFDLEYLEDTNVNKHYAICDETNKEALNHTVSMLNDTLWHTLRVNLDKVIDQVGKSKIGKVTYQSARRFSTVNKDLGLRPFHFVKEWEDGRCTVTSEINFLVTKY